MREESGGSRWLFGVFSAAALLMLAAAAVNAAEVSQHSVRKVAHLRGASGSFLTFSEDGSALVTAGGTEARVWSARTFHPLTDVLPHNGRVAFVSIDRAGRIVATGAGTDAFVWDARSGKRRIAVTNEKPVTDGALSPDGKSLATTDGTDAARVWDTTTGRVVYTFRQDGPVRRVLFSPDGRYIITAAGWAVFWDARTGARIGRHAGAAPEKVLSPHCIAFSADGKWFAAADGTDVNVSEPPAEGAYRSIDSIHEIGGSSAVVCFNGDGTKLFVATDVGNQVWNIAADRAIGDRLYIAMFSPAHDAFLSPDASLAWIATNSHDSGLWNVATGEQLLSLDGPPAKPDAGALNFFGAAPKRITEVPVIAMSPDGTKVAASFPTNGFTDVWEISKVER